LVWVWWATQSCIYTCSGPFQSCFGSLVGGEPTQQPWGWRQRWSSKRRCLRKQNHTTRLKTRKNFFTRTLPLPWILYIIRIPYVINNIIIIIVIKIIKWNPLES
jgi:hypothetical protein